MKDDPADPNPADDLDEMYRRAASHDPERPGEATRRLVMSEAALWAARRRARRPGRGRRWRLSAVFGTLAAASVAGLLLVPHFVGDQAPGSAPTQTKALRDQPPAVAVTATAPAADAVVARETVAETRVARVDSAPVEVRDAAERNALMRAVLAGRKDIVDGLLEGGADPNVTDGHGLTALQAARERHRPDIAAALLHAGAREVP